MRAESFYRGLSVFGLGAALLGACSYYGGDFGATPGGVKDMGLARELIAQGVVPPPEAFLVEGMFSEHELGLGGEPCQKSLCLRGGLGLAPTLAGEASGWLQVGLSSNVNPETFVRPSLSLILTVDVSGSMGWNYGEDTPGELTRKFLTELVPNLGAQDRVAIVTYGTRVKTPLSFTPGDKHAQIQAVIDGLDTAGSTNMEAGLERAYELARSASGTGETRVILFTDVQPNVGATQATAFQAMVREGAAAGVGLSVIGVGAGMGVELFHEMSHLRGGNAFSVFSPEDVDRLLEDEWPWMASPIAYDLKLRVAPREGFGVAESYGFPGSDGAPGSELVVSTVFLSKRKGALLVRLAPEAGTSLFSIEAEGLLSYEDKAGQTISEALQTDFSDEPLLAFGIGSPYQQPVIAKTVALAILVSAMQQAAEEYSTDQGTAVATMELAFARFSADAEALADPALDPEVALAGKLLELMRAGAAQGNLYGGF
jgi:Ca-activated chloride channel homolog